jgi:crossover junction endodeoxyribonuclease RuvC
MKPFRVLGIDPGLTTTGFGVVEQAGSAYRLLEYGTVRTPSDQSLPARLDTIYRALEQVVLRWKPDAGVIEEVFNKKNFQASMKIAHARAAAMVLFNVHAVPVHEYTASAMKKALAGYGQAEKVQVQSMVRILLGLKEPPQPFDAADALGHAICHLQHTPWLRQTEGRR